MKESTVRKESLRKHVRVGCAFVVVVLSATQYTWRAVCVHGIQLQWKFSWCMSTTAAQHIYFICTYIPHIHTAVQAHSTVHFESTESLA